MTLIISKDGMHAILIDGRSIKIRQRRSFDDSHTALEGWEPEYVTEFDLDSYDANSIIGQLSYRPDRDNPA